MSFDSTRTYTLIDKEQNTIGEIHSIKPKENWFIGQVNSLNLPEALEELFQKIEQLVKQRDYRSIREIEAEIQRFELQLKETGITLSEFQLDKKKKVYFKIAC